MAAEHSLPFDVLEGDVVEHQRQYGFNWVAAIDEGLRFVLVNLSEQVVCQRQNGMQPRVRRL